MNKFQIIVVLSLLLLSFKSGEAKPPSKYIIDANKKEEVNNNIENMNGVPLAKMKLKLYENDSLLFDTFDMEVAGRFWFMTTWQKDTITVFGAAGFIASPWSFYLRLYDDKYELTYMPMSESKTYKYNKEDTELFSCLSVTCPYTSCTLTAKPTFKKEDPITGVVEFESNDFWQVTSEGEKKYSVKFRVYFLAKEEKYNTESDDTELYNTTE